MTEKNGKSYRITERNWDRYREEKNINTLSEFFEQKDMIIEDMIRLKDPSLKVGDVYPRFDYNKRLVWLDESNYPPEVLVQMESDSEYRQFDIDYVLDNYKTMDTSYQNDDVVGAFLSMGS